MVWVCGFWRRGRETGEKKSEVGDGGGVCFLSLTFSFGVHTLETPPHTTEMSGPTILRAVDLTPEAFAPFGQVKEKAAEKERERERQAAGFFSFINLHQPHQVIRPTADGTPYGPPHDADLALPVASAVTETHAAGHGPSGTPRLYVMSLPARPALSFDRITFHARVSQCLASLDAAWAPWYLAVAAPTGSVEVK